MKQYLLGLDIGTTGTKAILFSSEGEIIGQAYRPYPTNTPKVLFSEQNPLHWWEAVCQTVREACREKPAGVPVAAISLSTQGGTMVSVDERKNPLRPAIVWNDMRCQRECELFEAEVGDSEYLYRKTGWHLDPGAPVVQMKWIQDHEPDIYSKTAMYLSVSDYISYKMTGITAVDISNVGINRFADIQRFTYEDTFLTFSGLKKEQLAEIVPSGQVIGRLTPTAADQLGLTTQTVLVSGAHDQYAVALGAGAYHAGDILIGSGTCWVVTCIGDAPAFESGLSQSVAAVPGKWGSIWSLSSGGVCLEWWRKNIMVDEEGNRISYSVINQEVALRKAAEDGLFFYPFSGRATQKKQFQRGSFVGMDLSHDKYHLARAVMEGVAFQIVWMLEAFPVKPSQEGLILAGGASKSEVWCQMVADIVNLPVQIPETADLACVGAAVLAGVGSGVYDSIEDGYARLAVPRRILCPNPEQVERYRQLMERYKQQAEVLGALYGL